MRIHSRTLLSTWLVYAIACTSACHATDPTSTAGAEYFEKHIRPVLVEHCYECHSERSEGGLRLDSRQGWSTGGVGGPALVPGDVDASLLMRALRYADPDLQMPPDAALPKEVIGRFEKWIRIGAPDPRDKEPTGRSPHSNPSDPIAGKEHWAFQPLQTQHAPAIAAAEWPHSMIDAFVMAQLEDAGLRPGPDANRQDLVRRAYYQLIGLPPTQKQISSFLEDTRPDAFERLVDRLLSSPHFGEHWGRHWLDLARYADSNGLDENFLFREAWRYRNWVIDAVNADTPFDRFVLEQIAGDLLPYESIEQRDRQRIAAGFLVLGPKVLLGNDANKQRMEVADEQLDTIGRSILGQTLGCARCHDHKFDPVPTADYYAMAGILTSTQVMEKRYMLGQQRVMEQLVGLGADGDARDAEYEQYWRDQPALKTRRKQAQSALELLEKEDAKALETLIKDHADAVAEAVSDTTRTIEQRIESQKALIAKLEKTIASPAPIPPRAMTPVDAEDPRDEHVRLAGQFDRLGDQIPRGFLTVLSSKEIEIGSGQSGRRELSQWLSDTDGGAGHLAARVLANRVWHHLIGRGIVRTVDNFGRTGEAASHPELLDHLARHLIDSQWSIKELVRSIALSRTFAMSSAHHDVAHAIDPENRLLWRAHRRRLSPESLRDSMLTSAGRLDLAPMESSVWYLGDQATAVGENKVRRRTDFPCRSIYLPVIRNDLPELFDAFDFADPHATTGMRSETTVATQGLYLMNNDSVMEAARATADRVLAGGHTDRPESQVDQMFELIFGIRPTQDERDELRTFIMDTENRLISAGDKDAKHRAWAIACHALFATSRFQILE